MTPALLLPAGLAALGALLVPLLLHLARRSQQQPTMFSALRWLRSQARPQRRIRFEEILLLALRLLLVGLLALWLARPALMGEGEPSRVLAVVPGVEAAPAQALVEGMDSLVWLAPGFPELALPAPTGPVPVASLLRELDSQLPPGAELVVAVPARLEGMDAQRPVLSRGVAWRVLPGAMEARAPFEPEPPVLQVRVGTDADGPLRYLRAAALAWHNADGLSDATFQLAAPQSPVTGDAPLLWLQAGQLPAQVIEWVEAGGTALLAAGAEAPAPVATVPVWTSATGEPLVEGGRLGRGRLLRFTRPLQPAAMPELLEADFPAQLRAVLEGGPPAPGSVAAVDHVPQAGAPAWPPAPLDLRPWLALLIALVVLVERWVATGPRRERTG